MNGVSDVLADCATRLIQAGLDAGIVRRVIATLRQDWGGDRHYIAKVDRQCRDTAIRAQLQQGASIITVARQTGLSRETVRRAREEWSL